MKTLHEFLKETAWTDVHLYSWEEQVSEWEDLSFDLEDLHETFLEIASDLRYYPEHQESRAAMFATEYLQEVLGWTEAEATKFIEDGWQ